ncbi:MAG TPA: PEGA domain-containing protein [Steroidobacteraceae bacterium]|nr:PEGA domain-containing protein [Steroidobacteraceae bacterium]
MDSSIFRQLARIGLGASIVCLGACASIMHGTHQDVGISSSPSGAQVSVDGQITGKTPIVSNLTRKDNHIIHLELAGYKPYDTTVTRSVSGWVWGNIVFGGLIGLAVDAINGGLYKLTPEQVSGTLISSGAAGIAPSRDGLYVTVVLSPQPGWQKVGQLERD